MRNNWDDEARRAYDRGYWDARREMEHHLQRHHNGDSYQGEYGRRDYRDSRTGYDERRREDNQPPRYADRGRTMGRYDSHSENVRESEYRRAGYDRSGDRLRDHDREYQETNRRDDFRQRDDDHDNNRSRTRDYPSGERPRDFDRDRDLFDRAGDEVRAWFGDDAAERRRRVDAMHDEGLHYRGRNVGRNPEYWD